LTFGGFQKEKREEIAKNPLYRIERVENGRKREERTSFGFILEYRGKQDRFCIVERKRRRERFTFVIILMRL